MRTLFVIALVVLFHGSALAATLDVTIDRGGFTGPLQLSIAPRVGGKAPQWSATRTVIAGRSSVRFADLEPGLYVVMASGPQPLQRLSAKANVDSDGAALRLVIPKATTGVRVTMAGRPLAHAGITFTHRELRWPVTVETNDDGRFAGELWEPGVYVASISRGRTSAPYSADVWLSPKPVTIDVPDRHVTGRILAEGKPLAGAFLLLRSETPESTLTVRTESGPDGRFEFIGVREGNLSLTARAPSYLDSDPVDFELVGAKGERSVELEL
ncbi:MAG TPA: carboxypeptidase-like regulatory domain-containing protein, partial [Thermoanaerobaculia bacterium]